MTSTSSCAGSKCRYDFAPLQPDGPTGCRAAPTVPTSGSNCFKCADNEPASLRCAALRCAVLCCAVPFCCAVLCCPQSFPLIGNYSDVNGHVLNSMGAANYPRMLILFDDYQVIRPIVLEDSPYLLHGCGRLSADAHPIR